MANNHCSSAKYIGVKGPDCEKGNISCESKVQKLW